MSATLPIGHWSWHERWLYPDQIRDMPERPLQSVYTQGLQHQQEKRERQIQLQKEQQNGGGEAVQYQQQQQQQQFAGTHPLHLPASFKEVEESKQGYNETSSFSTNSFSSTNPHSLQYDRQPSLPRRYRDGTFKRTTSEYCSTFRDPVVYGKNDSSISAGVSATQSAAVTTREIGGSTVVVTEEASSPTSSTSSITSPTCTSTIRPSAHSNSNRRGAAVPIRPELHSFQLWGRINNAHCCVPYETESQRAFGSGQLNADPVQREHFMRVERKDYKEALIKMNSMHVIRGGAGYEHTPRKK